MKPARAAGLLLLCLCVLPDSPAATEMPRLVLFVAVDQLRPDGMDAQLPGGLGRLVREGRVYTDAALEHAVTETCPGHSTMLTGQHPATTGIPANEFIDAERGESVYCVEDAGGDAEVFGSEGEGRSPRSLRATALGDWLKRARPGARVFSVSAKDRAAIMLGGQRPDAAYWFNLAGELGFTTSRYYMAELPGWVTAFNGALLEGLPQTWTHEATEGVLPGRADDFRGESREYGRTSGHPLLAGDPDQLADALIRTPYIDRLTLSFAAEIVLREGLGGGAGPDLLALSLSAVDTVGHLYGPYSHESRDTLLRLDRELGRFLDLLESQLGPDRLLVVLTSDHGVLPLPEWLRHTGQLACPVDGGRPSMVAIAGRLLWELHKELTGIFSWPRRWVVFGGARIGVRRAAARSAGVSVEDVVAVAELHLEAHPAIARAWTLEEIRNGTGELAELYRRSLVPGRSGDLQIQLEETCLMRTSGTTHGSPYAYDRRVPLIFWGAGIEPARVEGPAAPVDIAPTLARRLGVEVPAGLAGRVLFE